MTRELPPCPVVENEVQAIALGMALAKVLHFDKDWVRKVFLGTVNTYQTGPEVLNNELQSMWTDRLTGDERERILAEYVLARLT
jgi:hypothetical protein